MKVLGVIPSRYGSTRFPGKPLVEIQGKPLLQWVIEGVQNSQCLDSLLVATDDSRIADLAQKLSNVYPLEVVMTESDLATGTDRVWQAAKDKDCDVVVNIQGDEPLICGELVDSLCQPFLKSPVDMTTLARSFKNKEEILSANTAKIVVNKDNQAIYFSRHPLPLPSNDQGLALETCLKHIGMYAYSKSFLQKFCQQEPVNIEKAERLEQLRALYLGGQIQVVRVESDSWGVDTPEDVQRIEKLLSSKL